MKNVRYVNGQIVKTKVKTITGANLLEIEAGTNGFKGGDSGHGSRTYIRISDDGGTDWKLHAIHGEFDNGSIVIEMGGDSELYTIIKGLRKIIKILEGQIAVIHAEQKEKEPDQDSDQDMELQDLIAEQREQS